MQDPFKLMRENEVVYGSGKEKFYTLSMYKALWRRIRGFVDAKPFLVHPRSPVHYLLKHVEAGHDDLDMLTEDYDFHAEWCETTRVRTSVPSQSAAHFPADFTPESGCQHCPGFFLGSLNHFRSRRYQSFFDSLDASGMFYYHIADEDVVLGVASMILAGPKASGFFGDLGGSDATCNGCHIESTAEQHESHFHFSDTGKSDGDANAASSLKDR